MKKECFENYAKITITVLARESDINGPDELQLADALYEIVESLERWLKQEGGAKFRFQVRLS